MQNYEVRDITLAPSGHQKIEWVRNNMPLLRGLEEEFRQTKPFEGVKISLSVHLEAKTAYLCLVLAAGWLSGFGSVSSGPLPTCGLGGWVSVLVPGLRAGADQCGSPG